MPSGPSKFGGVKLGGVSYTSRFKRDLKKYEKRDPQLHEKILDAIRHMTADPRPGYLRFEKLQGAKDIYTVHVQGNVKISLDINGDHATLRRVAHHDDIDTSP